MPLVLYLETIAKMRFISLFAGIGGFDLGFEQAGLTCVAQVEIDAAARGVLAHHWPNVQKFEDIRTVGAQNLPAADIICGGFPCQDLSVAGKRAGLVGERSGLFYEMVRITDELRPAFLVWENVPGLLISRGGADFWEVLNTLDGIGYGGGWTSFDAQFFTLAQRRRRVFGVFARRDIGAARCAEILAIPDRLRWHPTPGKKTGASVTNAITKSLGSGGADDNGAQGGLLVAFGGNNTSGSIDVATACNAKGGSGRMYFESETFVIPVSNKGRAGGEISETLRSNSGGAKPMVFEPRYARNGRGAPAEIAPPLKAQNGGTGKGDGAPLVFQQNTRDEVRLLNGDGQLAGDLSAQPGMHQQNFIASSAVRRLTPTECERLQGFPDGWTATQADGPRYRQLGNAVAVPVARWIGQQIIKQLST